MCVCTCVCFDSFFRVPVVESKWTIKIDGLESPTVPVPAVDDAENRKATDDVPLR